MDDQKSEILAKAQQTAQNSGYGMVQYHYCVVTNGEVGSVEDFSNAVFRILNSEHGWARRRDFRTFYGRQLRFQYRARPSVDLADVLVGMFGAIQLPCGQQCDYQRRSLEFGTDVWMSGGGDLARYRTMVINHEVGHRLGHIDNEMTCAWGGAGQAAPLMQEQSIFLDGCAINEYPLDSELWIG